ncbi:hypothetical protein [Wolbachia endosymbiont of Litomosoides brasiliensis]|uniref:hypothetical protein n=1 Tax=Wolbachia endosymbiont of Litomosoides brasiliensis TaxID=1812117 RepID=UPI00158D3228|nr:hypothetical protein [Wolbachia endosymbiont of Litomosoides brasiliensis]
MNKIKVRQEEFKKNLYITDFILHNKVYFIYNKIVIHQKKATPVQDIYQWSH